MKFFNRHREQERIRKALLREDGQLIVIYGRRRCGKSTLIKNIIKAGDIYFMAQQTDDNIQRQQLAAVIAEKFQGFDAMIYPTWEALFSNLNRQTKEKFILALDEFPYMVKSSPILPSLIQKIIDQKLNSNYHIIICGSSQQMMNSMTLEASSPLYGRASEIIKIKPLEAGWITDYLECDATQGVKEYAVWGGIPRYWELRRNYPSFSQAVKNLILDNQGILHEEPSRLFLDDMRESVQAYSLLSLVGKGAHRISEIASRLNKPASQISRPIDKLINLGYLKRDIPFGENPKNSKKGLYTIAEPFFGFYFSFVVPFLSSLELNLIDQVFDIFSSRENLFISSWWENLCRRSVPAKPFNDIYFGPAQRWWGNNINNQPMEIDVVAQSLDGKYLLVGECKWSEVPNPKSLLENTQKKGALLPFAKNKIIIPVLFAKSSPDSNNNPNILTPIQVMNRLKTG
ncbi:ATP-binding protein [Thermophagus xiamenensis]|uniref:DUF234 domain-containing protein n=1 Tax=Thermophagus xiamenensis TaxID=385682 RepID=A0A1I2EV50_9BACT|nr:ATP-binding protein [Thermophagus xiamenensis]SFE96090.1 hypothetical protein SAMN05444380_12434 [Thermophagus xiamenensis]